MDIKILASSSKGNCYYIHSKTSLLLDAGIPIKTIKQMLDFKLSSIEGVLITHSHGDHSKAVSDLIKSGIDCYMSAETSLELGVLSHRVKIITPLVQFNIGEWVILPFPLEHDVFNLGYMFSNGIEKIAYITDTAYCKFRIPGLTRILIECNYDQATLERNVEDGFVPEAMKNRLMRSHFSLENVIEFLKANDLSKVEKIMVLHLSSGNANEKLIKETIQQVTGKHVVIAG